MKKLAVLVLVLFVLPSLFAIDLQVEKENNIETIVQELDLPAKFSINVTNNGAKDTFEIYNLLGLQIEPDEFSLNQGETKTLILSINPIEPFAIKGNYNYDYFIRADSDKTEVQEDFTLRVVNLKDSFEIGAGDLDIEDSSLSIYIQNTEDFTYPEVSADFVSPFFETSQTFSLKPHERKDFTLDLKKEDFKKLSAGFYTLQGTITVNEVEETIEGTINFLEADLVNKQKETSGFIIRTYKETNENLGNTHVESTTTVQKNMISRLFTTLDPKPDVVEREGTKIFYTWNWELNPGDTFEIKVRTNWIFPLLIIIFIVIIVALVKQFTRTNLVLKKRVSFVKATGGEFGLKITLQAHAQKFVDRVKIVDKIPFLARLYNKFEGLHPTDIDVKQRKIEWELPSLEPGEKRIFSYMIYSKIGVLGKFALPKAKAFFEKEGELHEIDSNRSFFIAEQKRKPDTDDYTL